MYATLNEIVQEQGETLNKIEDNCAQTKNNTKETVSELQKALSFHKTLRDRIQQGDMSILCLAIWVLVALTFFSMDFVM